MKIAETNICKLCQKEPETVKDTFLDCPVVAILWKEIENWLQNSLETGIKLDIDKIFGRDTSEESIDKTILCTKIIIYNDRKTGKKHHIRDVKMSLYNHLRIERVSCSVKSRGRRFLDIMG